MNFAKVLSNRPFQRLWIAQFVSMFGDFVAMYAVMAAVTFRMHGTASQISGVLVAFLAPFALIGPIAGVFVDRWNVKRTMIASDVMRAGLCLLLLIAKAPLHIYAVMFALSTVSTFFVPAQSVTTPLLVAREDLMAAGGLMQQTVQIVRILSPGVAGGLVGWAGEQACYWLDGASFAVSALLISTIAIHRPPAGAAPRTVGGVVTDLNAGFRFLFTHPAISFVILSLTVGTFATGCFGALLGVFVRDILHRDTKLWGLLGTLLGAGTMAGSVLMMRLKNASRTHLVSLGMLIIGAFIALMGLVPSTPVTVACTIGIGFGVAFILIPSMTLLQEATPGELRGRVMSTAMSLFTVSQGVALLISGALAAQFGIVPIFYASAVLLAAVGAVGWWRLEAKA